MSTALRERRDGNPRRRRVPPHGFCVQVDELGRRIQVRGRGELALLDAGVVLGRRGRARRDRRPQRCRQDNTVGGHRRRRPDQRGIGALRWHRPARQPPEVPRRDRLRPPGRHHPRRPAAATHAPLRSTTPAPVIDHCRRGRRRGRCRDQHRRTDRVRRRPGRVAERRTAQARQHCRRAPHRTARLLPRRADVRPRPGHEHRAGPPLANARRPVGDRRVHHALGRRPRSVRSRRLHGAGWTGRLRRHRRRRARALRGGLGSGALPLSGCCGQRRLWSGPPPMRREHAMPPAGLSTSDPWRAGSHSGASSPVERSKHSCATR